VRNTTEEALDADLSEILEYPDRGKLDTVSAKGERILLTRHAELAKYLDGAS
jgi:hypothetical protein